MAQNIVKTIGQTGGQCSQCPFLLLDPVFSRFLYDPSPKEMGEIRFGRHYFLHIHHHLHTPQMLHPWPLLPALSVWRSCPLPATFELRKEVGQYPQWGFSSLLGPGSSAWVLPLGPLQLLRYLLLLPGA